MNFPSRIHSCWLGKSIGGTLGLPVEGRMERLNLSFYDPVPTVAPPNDDLELQLVWLELVEKSHGELTADDFARAWLDHIHYMWDEYGRCRWNLRRGVPVEAAGTFENPFHDGTGSPIRSEIWACLFPGDPESAAWYSAMDASLDHGHEGIAGGVFFAVMQSLAASGMPLRSAIDRAMDYLPAHLETAAALQLVVEIHGEGALAWEELLRQHGNDNFTSVPGLGNSFRIRRIFLLSRNFHEHFTSPRSDEHPAVFSNSYARFSRVARLQHTSGGSGLRRVV